MYTRSPTEVMVCWYLPALTVLGRKSKEESTAAPASVDRRAAYQARSPWARVKCPPA